MTATCSWEQAVKWLQQDPRFRIIPKVSEKKQIFNGWKVQKQKEERVAFIITKNNIKTTMRKLQII